MAFVEMPAYATLSLLGGPALFWGGFKDMKRRRLMQDTPTARIRSMAMGLVEVNGTVEQRSTVTAPFSNRPCVYWQVEIAMRSGRRHGWTTIHKNSSGNPFFLRDETGLALVYPSGSDCEVAHGVEETTLGLSLPAFYQDYMRKNGIWMRHVARLSSLRFRERTISAGERVYVLGTAVPSAQVHTVSEADWLQATGTDGAHVPAVRRVHRQVSATIRQGQHEKTFIISHRSERALTAQLGWQSIGKLVAGPALTLFGLGWWLHRMVS